MGWDTVAASGPIWDKKQVVTINTQQKRSQAQEIDCAIHHVLKMDTGRCQSPYRCETELERAGIQSKRPNKDIVVAEQKNPMD